MESRLEYAHPPKSIGQQTSPQPLYRQVNGSAFQSKNAIRRSKPVLNVVPTVRRGSFTAVTKVTGKAAALHISCGRVSRKP
jgi:hypothetical protein